MSETKQHECDDGCIYLMLAYHRKNGKRLGKSYWTIEEKDEIEVFTSARTSKWVRSREGWGLHISDGKVEYLGMDQAHTEQVFLAKFRADSKPYEWHGYPGDHVRNEQDIPDSEILMSWKDAGLLPRTKIAKIAKGKRCVLQKSR